LIRRFLHIVFFLSLISQVNGQRADVWVFNYNSGLDFNNSTTQFIYPTFQWSITKPYAAIGSSITDCQGKLIVYASNIQVYNQNQKPMKNGLLLDNLNVSYPTSTSKPIWMNKVLIVPNPVDSLKYYIISSIPYTGSNPAAFKGVYYSVVDMRLDNGLGAVDSIEKRYPY